MTDIVERLRGIAVPITYEAADEIERLTGEVMEQARLNGMGGERELALRAVNERLRAALKETMTECSGHTLSNDVANRVWDIARRALEPKP